jgi:hypothetical protein
MKDSIVKFLENKSVVEFLIVVGVILSALIVILLPQGGLKVVTLVVDVVPSVLGMYYLGSKQKPQLVAQNIAWISSSIIVAVILFTVSMLISTVSLISEYPGAFLFLLIFGILFFLVARKHFKEQKQK